MPGQTPIERISSATSFLMFRVGDAIRDRVEHILEPFGLRGKDFRVLAFSHERPRSQQELCRLTGLDRTTMVAVIDKLERLGLAQREQDTGDRRRHVVTTTDVGDQTLQTALKQLERLEVEFLSSLTNAQRQQLNTALRDLFVAHDPTCARPMGVRLPQDAL